MSDIQKTTSQPLYKLRTDLIDYRWQRRKQCLDIGAFAVSYAWFVLYIAANFGKTVAPLFTQHLGAHGNIDGRVALGLMISMVGAYLLPKVIWESLDEVRHINTNYKQAKLDYDKCVGQLKGGELSCAFIKEQQGELSIDTQSGQLGLEKGDV